MTNEQVRDAVLRSMCASDEWEGVAVPIKLTQILAVDTTGDTTWLITVEPATVVASGSGRPG